MSVIGVNRPSTKLSGAIQRTGNIPVNDTFCCFHSHLLKNEITFAVEAVIVVFVHGPGHSEIGQFGHPIRVDQTIATSHVSVDRFMGKKRTSLVLFSAVTEKQSPDVVGHHKLK
jgi:hypothetical protein